MPVSNIKSLPTSQIKELSRTRGSGGKSEFSIFPPTLKLGDVYCGGPFQFAKCSPIGRHVHVSLLLFPDSGNWYWSEVRAGARKKNSLILRRGGPMGERGEGRRERGQPGECLFELERAFPPLIMEAGMGMGSQSARPRHPLAQPTMKPLLSILYYLP